MIGQVLLICFKIFTLSFQRCTIETLFLCTVVLFNILTCATFRVLTVPKPFTVVHGNISLTAATGWTGVMNQDNKLWTATKLAIYNWKSWSCCRARARQWPHQNPLDELRRAAIGCTQNKIKKNSKRSL